LKPSIKKNYLYNLSYQIISVLVPLVTTPYISRVLNPEGIGLYSFTNSIVTYFTLFAVFGTGYYGQRQIAYVRDDKTERSKVFLEVLSFRAIMTILCAVAYVLFVFISRPQNIAVYLIQGILIICVAFDISWFFMGLEQFKRTAMRNIAIKLLGMALIFAFVKKPEDVGLYAGILSGSMLLGNLSLFPYLKHLVSITGVGRINPFRDTKTILTLFVPTIAVSIYTVLDRTMIGLFSETTVQNGYYEQSERIIKSLLVTITALGTVCIPRTAAAHAKENLGEIRKIILRSYRFVWFLGLPLIGGLVVLSSQFSIWFYGKGWDEVPLLISVFSLLLIGIGINNVTGVQYLIPTGLQNVFTATVVAGAVINFALNLLLIPHFAALGAAIASVTAEIAIAIIQLIYVRKIFRIKDVISPVPKYLISSAVMAVVLYIVRGLFPSTVWGTGILVVIGVGVYAALLLAFRDSFFIDNCRLVLHKIRRKS